MDVSDAVMIMREPRSFLAEGSHELNVGRRLNSQARYAEGMMAPIGAWIAVLSALVAGCVSGGNNVLSGDRHVTWLDDGVMTTATLGQATWASMAGRDSVNMLATTDKVGVTIYAGMTTPFTPQTFVCGQITTDQSLLLSYRNNDPAGPTIHSESCRVAFTQIGAVGGAPIIGTFEMVFDLSSGGTKTITNGSFDLPLSL